MTLGSRQQFPINKNWNERAHPSGVPNLVPPPTFRVKNKQKTIELSDLPRVPYLVSDNPDPKHGQFNSSSGVTSVSYPTS